MASGGAALQPTFNGHVATTQDALVLFEACLQGHLSHVPRRPHDRERSTLIRSGSVFIYEENASGIKRWTDGVNWSPSRILGNFLVYRELDKPFPPGEKKKALKKPSRRPSRPSEPYSRPDRPGEFSPSSPNGSYGDRVVNDQERSLIGSLVDSYGFKQDGLVKKTMSVTVQGVTHHLVSYYNVADVMAGNLRTPTGTETLQYIRPRPELVSKQSFRSPIEDTEDVNDMGGGVYRYGHPGPYYDSRTQQHYYPGQPYPMTIPPQPMNTGYQSSMPPMGGHYLASPVPNGQMSQDRPAYPGYEAGYGRSIPTTPTSAISTTMPERVQLQNGMYPPTSMSRPMSSTLSPLTMADSNRMGYRPPYSMPSASPIDGQRPPQQSPVTIKHEDRREYPQTSAPSYTAQGQGYYPPTNMTPTWPAPTQQ